MNIIKILIKLLSAAYTAEAKHAEQADKLRAKRDEVANFLGV